MSNPFTPYGDSGKQGPRRSRKRNPTNKATVEIVATFQEQAEARRRKQGAKPRSDIPRSVNR